MEMPDNPTLLDQSASGVTLFVQRSVSSEGFVIKGELAEETITVFNTPNPSEMQAEISFLGTNLSDDGTSIKVGVSVQNFGQIPITITTSDVSATNRDGTPLVIFSSTPLLPKEIAPGKTETFYFTFPRPSSQTATIKIFEIEYKLEGY